LREGRSKKATTQGTVRRPLTTKLLDRTEKEVKFQKKEISFAVVTMEKDGWRGAIRADRESWDRAEPNGG